MFVCVCGFRGSCSSIGRDHALKLHRVSRSFPKIYTDQRPGHDELDIFLIYSENNNSEMTKAYDLILQFLDYHGFFDLQKISETIICCAQK